MTAEDQLIPSTPPLILCWKVYSRFNCKIHLTVIFVPDLSAISIPDLRNEITAEELQITSKLQLAINTEQEIKFLTQNDCNAVNTLRNPIMYQPEVGGWGGGSGGFQRSFPPCHF